MLANCNCCGGSDFLLRPYFSPFPSPTVFDERQLLICKTCAFERINCLITSEDLGDFYANGYWEGKSKSLTRNSTLLADIHLNYPKFYRLLHVAKTILKKTRPPHWVSQVLENVQKKAKIIEFGAGSGDMSLALNIFSILQGKRYEYDVTEFGDYWNSRYEHLGYLKVGDDIELIKGNYDLVISSHVFEHIIDPITSIKSIFNILKPGGMLLMNLPNQGRSIREIDAPHVTFWTPENMTLFLENSGFDKVRVDSIGPSREDYYKDNTLKVKIGDTINAAGNGWNLCAIAFKPNFIED
jgi:SAM-dependent methyltransferase